jgi:hypothetical protein
MATIPLIALQGKAPEQQDSLQQYGRLLQIKNMQRETQMQEQEAPLRQQALQQQVQSGQIGLQQQQQALKDQQAATAAMHEWDGSKLEDLAPLMIKNGASATAVMSLKKQALEQREKYSSIAKDDAATGASNIATMMKKNDMVSGALSTVMQAPDEQLPQALTQTAQQLAQQGLIDPQHAQQAAQLAQSGAPAEQLRQQLDLLRKGYLSDSQLLDEAQKKAQTASEQANADEKNMLIQNGGTQAMADARYRNITMNAKLGHPVSDQDKAWAASYEKQKTLNTTTRINLQNSGAGSGEPEDPSAVDPNSQSILAQTGLSLNAFRALTGQTSQLPRDRFTRNQANREAQKWANEHGVDVSTLASQYKANNDVLAANIARMANTKIMENELQGTISNLQGVVKSADLGRVNFANVAKIWAGQQVNDDMAQQYAMHLNQLRNELAAYNAATQGRSGSSILQTDMNEADKVLRNGMASGSLQGLSTAVANSTGKMKGVMENSVDAARKAVWDTFGVGDKYKNHAGGSQAGGGISIGSVITQNGHKYKVTAVDANGKPTAADPVR